MFFLSCIMVVIPDFLKPSLRVESSQLLNDSNTRRVMRYYDISMLPNVNNNLVENSYINKDN